MSMSSARRNCILVLALSAWLPMPSAGAQPAEEVPAAPPLFSERTEDQVEQFLEMAPAEASLGAKPGLRVFTISNIEPADLLALFVASCASLFLVAPGAFMLYSALERSAMTLAMVGKGIAVLAVLSLAWILFLYSLAFSRNAHSYDVLEKEIEVIDRASAPGSIFIGDFSRMGLRGLSSHWTAGRVRYPLRRMGDRIPEIHLMTFQLTLFLQAVAPLLVVTSRVLRSWGHILFWLLWGTLVYAPVTYWTQGGGWLGEAVDAGSSVTLHVCVGLTALGLMFVQWRAREPLASTSSSTLPAKPSYLAIGGLLFLAGSLLLAGSRSIVFHPWATFDWLNVFLAAGVGLLTWMALAQRVGRDDHSALVFGAVSGIVAIAAGCSSVSPIFAILIAAVGATGSFVLLHALKPAVNQAEWQLFSVHGVSALIGIMLTGLFATADIAGADSSGRPILGLIGGNFELWRIQVLTGAIAAIVALAAGFFLPTICNGIGLLLAPRESEPAYDRS